MRAGTNILSVVFAAIMLCLGCTVFAQNSVEVNASLDPKQITIGDWVKMKLEVRHAKDVMVFWPEMGETIQVDSTRSIDVIATGKIDTAINGAMITQTKMVTITAFDSGTYMIPPIKFGYKLPETDSISETTSLPLLLTVQTVAIDTAQSYRPEKGPLEIPFSWKEYIGYIVGGGIGILAMLAILIYLLTRKKKPVIMKQPELVLPPHELALRRLREVEAARYWQQGEVKYYYSEISTIVRGYIEERFRILALESTTYELIIKLNNIRMDRHDRQNLRELLDLADLVKFAKAEPLPDEHLKAMTIAIEFVEHTKPAPKVEETEGGL
jgi:hypothetical protein